MSDKAEMVVNFDAFNKDFNLADLKVNKAAVEGMRQAGLALIQDADDIEPKTPHLTGELKGSARVDEDSTPFTISILVGFNTPYAAAVHENTAPGINWTEPGSGPKFLESKVVSFKDTYIKMAADEIDKVL